MADDSENEAEQKADEDRAVQLWGSLEAQDRARAEALKTVAQAHMVNRIWTFEIDHHFEVAFGNARGLVPENGPAQREWVFHVGVSMNYDTAKALHERLGAYVEGIEKIIKEQQELLASKSGEAGESE